MGISPEAENQQVNLSLADVVEDFGVRVPYTDECVWLANLSGVMGHDRFDRPVKVLLQTMELFRMIDLVGTNDIQHIEFRRECVG
jgi:hypothetical protein